MTPLARAETMAFYKHFGTFYYDQVKDRKYRGCAPMYPDK